MRIKAGILLSLIVIMLMIFFRSSEPIQVHAVTSDVWWDEAYPYRLPVKVDGSGIAAVSINFSDEFAALGREGTLLDVRSIRVVPYRNGVPGEAIPYEETYSTLLIDADTLNMDPSSTDPYWSVEELFTLDLDTARTTQGTGSVHAHFKHKKNACTKTGFNYHFNDSAGNDWSDFEVLIYDVLPEVNANAVDQTPDLFFFELGELKNCAIDWINGPALVMDEWNHISVSLTPFGKCIDPDPSNLAKIRFFVELNFMSNNPGNYGEGDEFDLWLDNLHLVDQDGGGEIRWQAEADVDKYYIYFDILNHEGHALPETTSIGVGNVKSMIGAVEAGGYFHQITDSTTEDMMVWRAPIEEKILRTHEAPVSFNPLKIQAARGELEAFQIVVNSPKTRKLSVGISDFFNGEAVIHADQVELFRVDYIEITHLSDFYGRLGFLPDPLYPISLKDPITFTAGENQPLWFRIRVPSDAEAGVYSGIINIGSAAVPITLEVWDFTFPQNINLYVEFGFEWETVLEAYGAIKSGVKHDCYDQVREAIQDTLDDYHITPRSEDRTEPPEDVLVYTLTNYEVEIAHAQQLSSSKRVWWDFIYSDQPPFPNPAVIDRQGLDARILPWMAWLDRINGIAYDQAADWDPNPWSEVFSNDKNNGDGFFFYPPKDGTLGYDPCEKTSSRLVTSIRLELFREGLEDYGYLLLLNEGSPEIDIDNDSDAWARTFIGSRTAFLRIPGTIDAIRVQIADLLVPKQPEFDLHFLPLVVN